MAKFRVEMVDGRTYEVEAPEGTPQETLFAAIQERNPLAFKSTEALEAAPSAPFKAADIGRAAKAGVAGGLQSLTDIFGAGNVASQYLEEAQKAAYQGMSPERIEEMQRREEIKKRAEGKGLGKEISSYLGGFAEAPLQTAVQALAGSAPIIASSALPGGPAAGIARLLSAARGPTAVGAAMGLGGQKGQDYEAVKQALLEQGVPEPEAERRAQEASAYSMQNILRQAGAAAAGAAEGRFGVEPAIGKLLTRRTATGAVKPPTWDVAIGQSILGEAAPEALQAAVGQLGTNQALNQAGIPTEITKGLAGTIAHDALVGAVLGLGLSPAQKANMARDYAATQQEERNKRQEEERAKIAEIERKQREEYEKAGYAAVQKPLAPADLTKNPLGSFTAEDLQPEVVAYIDNYRNQMGLPKIQQYSVEDIADAMPGLDKKREREALGEIVGKKAGYTPEATVSVQNVLDQALAKNIDIEGKGFTDFLARTTGVSDFKEMTDPQLFAAFKAISALPDSPTVREMEAGTNAVRFDDTQYTAGLNALDITLEGLKRPVSVAAAVDEIKFASGLRSDKAANALLEEAIRRGDLDETQTPRFEVVRPSTGEILGRRYDTAEEAEKAKPEGAEVRQVAERQIAPPTKVAALPEGYDIQEGLLKTGEAPQAFDVKAGDQILSRVKSEEEAQAKLNSYSQTRAAEAANAQKVIERQQKRVADSAQRLNAMEAGGQGRTAAYQNMAAKHARLIDEVNKIIARQNDRIKKFDPSITPITISPVGAKAVGRTGFTVLKGGVPLTTLPTREAAERAVLGDLTTGRLEELAQKKERRGLGPKAAEEIERRAGRLKPEKSPEVEALEQNLRKVLDKFGLKDVALEVAEAIAGGKAGGSYLNSLIKVALDEKNPVRTLRHESLHALRDLGFFTDQQWNALTNQARSKWIDTYLKQRNIDGEPLKAGETSRYDAYVMAYKGDIDAIVEEAIADAFADFDVNKAPPGMLSALLNKLRSFFEALRNALSGAGFQTAEDVFGKIERAELAPTKKAEGAEKLSVKGQEAAQKVIDAVQDKLIIDPKLYSATSLEMQTGKSGDKQFKQQDLGGIPEIVNFLEKRRRDSGVPILDISKPADRELLSQLMAAEAMASINAGGAALEWYDETVAKTIGMAALKYQELGTDPDKQMAFKIATAIASQGMNVEDNLKFAMQQYDYFDKNGRFEELGKGTDATAMRTNYVLANKMMDEYTLGELRKFLQTPFKVEELRAAGFKIGGELGEETVLGSSIFGPKIGFGFYSNLNGNFEPVTMDMWFMRLIGRLTGNLRVFEADLFKSQMDRFRQAFDEAGVDGVYADEFKSDIVEKARKDDDEAVKLARIVNSVFTSDFKNNRALYDEGAKKKTELVYAAQNVLKSVDSPKDAPDNGTERIQLRDVVKRTVDRIERAIGKRIPPASLQALVWYPEQELYKALGAKLRVTSQDYAGAMKKILEGEGYGTKELDAAARSGARQVQQMANKPVGPAVKPTGEKPTAPYTEGERAEFLERATTKSIIEQERKAPKRRKVVFEVAPDPNNIEVTAAWRQLPTEDRLRISEKVAKQMLGRAMEATGASGRVVSQVGSYLEDTNPSFALFLDKGNSVDVSKFLGYVLGQDSMMVISPRPGPGLDKVGAVIVDVNTNDSAKIDAVYQKLREIEVNNEKPVGGQSTMNGKMIVLNYSNLETEQLAQAIRSKLQGEYDVAITDVYSAFPEKDSYDYSDPSADPRGAQGDLRRTARTLRDQATEALAAELQTAAAPKEKLSLRAAEAPPSGVPANIWQMHTQLRTQEAQLSGELPMPTRADGTAQTAGVLEGIQKRLFRRYNAAVKALVGEDESLPFMQRLNTISSIQDAVREGDDQALETYKVSSPEEYAEVMGEKLSLRAPQTPEFKQWFGNSKIVDENGEPKVMYHGTARDFEIFQPKQANAIFLTDNPKFAEDFSDLSKDYMRKQLWNSSAPEQHFAWLRQATEDAFKNNNISQKDRKEILADLKTIESQGGFGSLGSTPVLIETELFKILDNNLPTGENIIPVYVKAENPFDFENPTHVRRLMAGLKNQISGDYLMAFGGRMAMKNVPAAIREGSWKIIEAEDVQEVLRNLFDGFYVKEGGVKNLAVYKPNQIKSVFNARPTERPEMRLSLRSGADRFNQDEIEKLRTPGYKSREKLIDMPIRDFLLLAEHGYVESKQKNARELLAKGEKFSSIPYLKIDGDRVFGHEGRHRARALQELGYTRMPVLLRSSNIRWSEQNDPEKFDYIKDWPKILRAEEKALDPSFAIPFPVQREESEDAYQPTPERFSIRASIDPSLMAMVDRTTHQRDEKTFVQSITEAIAPKSWSHFRQQALNRYNRLSEADKIRAEKMGGKYLMADASAESAALMSDLAAGVSASALGVHDRNGGIPVYRNGITTVWNDNGNIKGPTAIFAPLAKYNDPAVYQLYQFWAGSKRARRLYDQGKERLYTPAEITRANELLQQFPEFEDIQKEWVKYNNGLMEYAVATGVLSRERADEFMRYSDYVPFYRQLDGEGSVGPKIFQAISGVKPPKKIKGGEQPLDDFLETVVRNTQSIIQSGMKNVAAQRAVKLAVDIDLGERLPKKASGPDIVTVLENGREVSYAVADPLFIEAVKSLNLPDLPFIGLLSGPANLLRNLVTKDPGFMLANMMRDSMAAWVTSGVNMTPVSSTVINFGKALAGTSPEFQALLNAGVIGGYEFSQNVIEGAKTLEKSLGKAAGVSPTGLGVAAKPFTSLWETLEKGTTASDAATRMEVYKQVLAETGNEAEALYRALEVMNFNRKGSSPVVRILTAAVPFLNARMQGLDVLYRAAFGQMANKDAAAIQRAFFVRGMSIAAISCMYWALTHDDDEYQKQEEETKDNNWLVPSLGVKIPIPFEVGVLFKVIPERIMAYTFGDDTGQDFLKSMGRNLAATLMINPIPQTVLPVVEATTNFSFFTMRPIVGQGMEDVAPQFQVGPSTSIIAEQIGGALGISPMKLDHMIKGYTGTMGMYMVDLIDSVLNMNRDSPRPAARFEQLPVIKRFALDPEARGNVTAYYDLKNSVDQAVRTSNYLERTQNLDAYGPYMEETVNMLATRDYVLDLEKTMKEFREMKTLIRASDMSGTDKRDALIEVNRMEDQLTKNIRQIRAFARQ